MRFQRVTAVAGYLRRNDPSSPLPYLLLAGLRWGELRAAGTDVDANLLEAPPTGTRQALKKAATRFATRRKCWNWAKLPWAFPAGEAGWTCNATFSAPPTNWGTYQVAAAIGRR